MNITQENVVALITELVEEKGEDFKYQNPDGLPLDQQGSCLYVHQDRVNDTTVPGCIAGHLFVKLGVDLDDLAQWETKSAQFVAQQVSGEKYDIYFNDDALIAITRAQRAQDSGYPWGEALRAAKAPTDETFMLNEDVAL